jgi:hypothetical protein
MSSNRKIIPIYTDNPEQEIWNYIANFEIEKFVDEYIDKNISSSENKNISNNEYDRQKSIITITNNAKQAREFYMLSKQLPLSSRPVLLHYAFEKLTIMLVLIKLRYNQSIRQHGLTYCDNIQVKKDGLFVKLHQYFYPNNDLQGKEFDLKDVINANAISRIKINYNILNNQEIKIATIKTQNIISIHELEREFMFSFVLSVLARYQISKWMEILSGREEKIILKIRRYYESIQLLFPNLILNELYDKFLEFYNPAQFAIVEVDKYDIPLDF